MPERNTGNNDNIKKQIPLRLSASLFREITAWAEDDFRSVNGQIEYLLTQCVRQRRKKAVSSDNDADDTPADTENSDTA